jgi:hypothetical protein
MTIIHINTKGIIYIMDILSQSANLILAFGIMENALNFQTDNLRININEKGQIESIYDISQKKEYFPAEQITPLLSISIDHILEIPKTISYDDKSRELRFTYKSDVIVTIQVDINPTHITFELISIIGANPDIVMWGPYPVTIFQTVGEVVGVVRDDVFAFGIQTLNIQTIGGRPAEYANIGVGSEAHSASSTEYGSAVQAYSREKDGGILGSKIALFGCPADQALATIGKIEVAEGLPHPILDGIWGKISPTAKLSYLITNFSEQNLEEILEYAHKAGLKYVYHEGPFDTWGHFKLNPTQFPNGDESMKKCVEKAEKAGIHLGIHTLTNFITTNDPYVTPIPDPRLMRIGSSNLTGDIDEKDTEIMVARSEPFKEQQWLSTAIIDEELVQYEVISDSEPYKLIGCKRGAFGTKPSVHRAGSDIGKLADHPYRVFFPNLDMQNELTTRLVELFNNTGLKQISFDGLEGCFATGHGLYAENLFVKQCFDGWKNEVINDASGLSHYLWHIHTRMNWGEPWGKAMREGMTEYRFKNQSYFERNLFPRMLGWFLIRTVEGDLEATSLDDVEWVMTKCAGYDAGCAIVASLNTLKRNGQIDVMFKSINEWEKARLSGAFSDEQRQCMKENEYHLEPASDGWLLYPVDFAVNFVSRYEEKQPGQPSGSEYEIANKFDRQPLRFVLRIIPNGSSETASIKNPSFEVGFRKVTFPINLKPTQYLVCDGDKNGVVYDSNWNLIQIVQADSELPCLQSGNQRIMFDCEYEGDPKPSVQLSFKMIGNPEIVK